MSSEERPAKLRKLSHDVDTQLKDSRHGIDVPSPQHSPHHIPLAPSNGSTSLESTVQPANTAAQSSATENVEDVQDLPSVGINDQPAAASSEPPLSKSALKKLRKKQEWEAGKEWRKIRRKEKHKEKKERQREHRAQEAAERKAKGLPAQKKPPYRRPIRLPVTFVVDCDFDDKMLDKERVSLGSQLTRAYSDNNRAPYQAHLMVSSWGGLLKERFDTVLDKHYHNWKGIRFIEGDFVTAADLAEQEMKGTNGGRMEGVFRQYAVPKNRSKKASAAAAMNESTPTTSELSAPDQQSIDVSTATVAASTTDPDATDPSLPTEHNPEVAKPDPAVGTPLPEPEVVYLTSDSPHTLTTLNPHSTYIIGGLVDKNRHKGICYRSAVAKGVKTAKLPIGDYMEMQSRFVLATNHVVEIMVRWLECGDWGEAFLKVIPKRKGGKLREAGDKDEDLSSQDDGNDRNSVDDYDDDDIEQEAAQEDNEDGEGQDQRSEST